jgi:hypothetical protein
VVVPAAVYDIIELS